MGAIMVMVSVLSFWDDLRSLGPAIRFGGHLLAALLALMLLGWSQLNMGMLGEDLVWPWGLLGVFLMILWVTGYINGFNFMDGINGIAAGQAAMTALGMGLISGWASGRWGSAPVLICFVIAGAALGFAPHNFPRARMFMGDVGSASLGFALAVLVLWLASDLGWKLFVPLVLLHANFVLDTGITLTRRVLQGERWYAPHREHFYQRLVRAGRGHTFVTLVEMGLQSLVLGLLTLYIEVEASGRLVIVVAVVVIWLIFFAWVETCFRKHMTNRGPTAHG